MYTPEQEFGQVSSQYGLNMRTINIAIGATAMNIAQSIVSVLCQACSMGEDADNNTLNIPKGCPTIWENPCFLHVQRLGPHQKLKERTVAS